MVISFDIVDQFDVVDRPSTRDKQHAMGWGKTKNGSDPLSNNHENEEQEPSSMDPRDSLDVVKIEIEYDPSVNDHNDSILIKYEEGEESNSMDHQNSLSQEKIYIVNEPYAQNHGYLSQSTKAVGDKSPAMDHRGLIVKQLKIEEEDPSDTDTQALIAVSRFEDDDKSFASDSQESFKGGKRRISAAAWDEGSAPAWNGSVKPASEPYFIKEKQPPFTRDELRVMVDGIMKYYKWIYGDLAKKTPLKKKTSLWTEISNNVSALGVHRRKVADVKKRWTDLKIKVKKMVSDQRRKSSKTGGGPPPKMKMFPWEESCLSTLDITALEGFGDAKVSGRVPKEQAGPSRVSGQEPCATTPARKETPTISQTVPTLQEVLPATPSKQPPPPSTSASQNVLFTPAPRNSKGILCTIDLESVNPTTGEQMDNLWYEEVSGNNTPLEDSDMDEEEEPPIRRSVAPIIPLLSPPPSDTVTIERKYYEGLMGRVQELEAQQAASQKPQNEVRFTVAVERMAHSLQQLADQQKDFLGFLKKMGDSLIKQGESLASMQETQKGFLESLNTTCSKVKEQGLQRTAAEKRLRVLVRANTAAIVASTQETSLVGATISNNICSQTLALNKLINTIDLASVGPSKSSETSQTSDGEGECPLASDPRGVKRLRGGRRR